MLAHAATPAPDHRAPLRIALLGLSAAVTASVLLSADRHRAPAPLPLDASGTTATMEAFVSGGVASDALGMRVSEDGRFAVRGDVTDALHTTVQVSIGGEQQALNIAGVRIVGLYRGAHDLTTLQGARVLILGRCAAGAPLRECSAESVEVRFAPPRPFVPRNAVAAA